MSSSVDASAIFMSDPPNKIKKKIVSYAFSGGGDSAALHRERGGNCSADVPFLYLTFFLDDDEKLAEIKRVWLLHVFN